MSWAVAKRQGVPQALVGAAHGASGALGRAASPPGAGNPLWLTWEGQDLNNGAQFRDLRMLNELGADPELSTDSHEARPKAEPGHVPLDERAREAERILELPPGMDTSLKSKNFARKSATTVSRPGNLALSWAPSRIRTSMLAWPSFQALQPPPSQGACDER